MFYTPEVVGQTVDTVRVMNYDMYYGGGLEKIRPVTVKMRPDLYGERQTDHERFITSLSSHLCVFVAHGCFFLLEHSRVWLTLVRCKRHRTHVHVHPWGRAAMSYWKKYVPVDNLVMGLPAYASDYFAEPGMVSEHSVFRRTAAM